MFVNIGLIGCGGRLCHVVKAMLGEDRENRIRVVSAYDPDPISQDACVTEFPDCAIAASEEELVNSPDIQWVFIGSWNCHHGRQAVLALNAGKDVFCEKPLATNLEDCLAIQEAVRKSGKRFAFGLVLRYSPHYQRIEELIRSGAIGKIISFEFNETLGFNHGGYFFGNWRREKQVGGSAILEKCCHDLDLANWIVGSVPMRVASFGGRDIFVSENASQMERIGPNEKGQAAYCTWHDWHRRNPFDGKADIFDNQVVILEYANGVRATFHMNCNAAILERRFYLCGTEGTLRGDVNTGTIEVKRIGWDTKVENINTLLEGGGHAGGDEVMATSMVECLLRGATPLASVEEGLRSSIAAFGIDLAADEGRVVELDAMWRRAGIL